MNQEFMYSINQNVRTKKYAYEGRIHRRYNRCPGSKEWQDNQYIPFTKKEIHSNWYLIETLIDGQYHGSVYVPQDDIIC